MALPLPPAEVPVIRSLDVLAPKFRLAVDRTLHALALQGRAATVSETLRTDARQAFLYGFGRTYDDGRGIVTNARTVDTTWHGYGLAVDVIASGAGWNAPAAFWTALGAAAEAEGLTWGGRWDGLPDRPHLQWGQCRRSPSVTAVKLKRAGGLEAVWREVNAV